MPNDISKTDVSDEEFVDAVELASDGSAVSYRTVGIDTTTAANRNVVISTPTDLDRLDNVDEPLQVGDIVVIPTGDAAGTYTIELIVDTLDTFRVFESIADSVGGTADLFHPAGATKIGVDVTGIVNSDGENLQEVLEDLDQAIDGYNPIPDCIGQVMFSIDGATFVAVQPVTSNQGWLVNEQGVLVINPKDDT